MLISPSKARAAHAAAVQEIGAMHQRHDDFSTEAIRAKLGQALPLRERLLRSNIASR
jgi:hypothetical protein